MAKMLFKNISAARPEWPRHILIVAGGGEGRVGVSGWGGVQCVCSLVVCYAILTVLRLACDAFGLSSALPTSR